MTDTELNESLLKTIGFKHALTYVWVSPEDDHFATPPDLVHDLNACFKWLVPKLQDCSLVSIDFTPPFKDEMWLCTLGYSQESFYTITEQADNPAKALCLAALR